MKVVGKVDCWRAYPRSRRLMPDVSSIRRNISKVAGCFASLPRNTVQKTAQAFICEADFSQPVMGATFYFPISRLESANEVTPPPLRLRPTFLSEMLLPTPLKGRSW